MFITKTLTAENGANVAHHQVVRVLHEAPGLYLQVTVHSWPSEASRLAGHSEIARWNYMLHLDDVDLDAGFRAGVLAAIVAQPGWAGATTSLG